MDSDIRTLYWQDDAVVMIDQRALPLCERHAVCRDPGAVVAAIKDLTVRGAPAIGVAAAMGIALGALRIAAGSPEAFRDAFSAICAEFAAARPTARNLFWAIERMERRLEAALDAGPAAAEGPGLPRPSGPPERCFLTDGQAARLAAARRRGERRGGASATAAGDPWRFVREALVAEAIAIGDEDVAINRRLGANGRSLIPAGARILTHCNAGALATAGYGTALGVIRAACEEGKPLHVYVDETRPVLQGARLTAWELMREGIPCTLIAEGMAGFLMQRRGIDLVIVGADRIAANGDTANKIGTYALAVLAWAHGIPFYVAAPLSTIDRTVPDGKAIPIEERDASEMTHCGGVRTAPEGTEVWNPAFDVTPHDLIAALVTEAGVIRQPLAAGIAGLPRPASS
jgi:methylthioribose-1-phosphate isomerase